MCMLRHDKTEVRNVITCLMLGNTCYTKLEKSSLLRQRKAFPLKRNRGLQEQIQIFCQSYITAVISLKEYFYGKER